MSLEAAQRRVKKDFKLPRKLDLLHYNPAAEKGSKRLANKVMAAQVKAAMQLH